MSNSNCCRTCLRKGKEMRSIYTHISISGQNVCLSEILKRFYDYEVSSDDSLPQEMCLSCVYQLTITYSFKALIESSARTLLENIKYESCNISNYEHDYDSEDIKPTVVKKNIRNKIKRAKPKSNTLIASIEIFCVECKAKFNSLIALNEHCTNNHPVKNSDGRGCEYCNEKFEDIRSLVMHRKQHLQPYVCEHCWTGFYCSDEQAKHLCRPSTIEDKIKPEKVLRQCDQCGKSYPAGYIRVHMLTHGSKRAYRCLYCPKTFKVPGSLNSHILWNHKRTRNHKCEICNATFISSSSRSSHVRKHHLKEKKYSCESCGKKFFSKSELQRHSLTHTGVKNFHCYMCEKSYQTRYGLNVHLKSH
ncbi:unnamed protein product [Leptidea sinapis]|uniref:Protein krueppel n=1 Tax=Leptidea sinapis TaxID=189913 RepID=A0A5E4PS88_9NEOP|nr:unnamed protein product [Leptidea sinapis]